ncbi:MAG: hypothetical protein RML56_10230 [Burkholderiales bacterium]|nr:hypothetical protein [Burkholderiales bacterium]
MRHLAWLLALAILAALAYWVWYAMRRYREKKEAEAARMSAFLAQASALAAKKTADPPAANPGSKAAPAARSGADVPSLAQPRLLFEAAAKAGEAGEPALAIRLYARLIARYPESPLAREARAAVEAQKKKLGLKG